MQKGYTVIELLIVCIVLGIVFTISFGIIAGGNLSVGVNGIVESRCINGVQFVVTANGNTRQVFDQFGKALECR